MREAPRAWTGGEGLLLFLLCFLFSGDRTYNFAEGSVAARPPRLPRSDSFAFSLPQTVKVDLIQFCPAPGTRLLTNHVPKVLSSPS